MQKIIYWIATAFMCVIFLFSAYNYFFNYEMVSGFYDQLGFPHWLIYPSATLKIFGVVAILTGISNFLKEWAYAGFFFDSVLAFTAHNMVKDEGYLFALIALICVVISRYLDPKVFIKHPI